MATNICPKCKSKIREGAEYCPECGKPTFDKCPKCGAKLNKNNNFCIKCGFKIRKPLTFADNSVIGGIFAIVLGWVPIIGWAEIVLALIYGFLSLRRIKKGNTRENRKKAITGIVLGFIGLAIAFFVTVAIFYSTTNKMTAPMSGVSATNENGMMVLIVYGEELPLRFFDETTSLPVSGLSVGYAVYKTEGVGALVVIDPQKRFPPQIVLLEGSETNEITGNAVSEDVASEVGIQGVSMSKEAASVMQKVEVPLLKKTVKTIVDIKNIMSAVILAAKVLDQSGLSVGDYAGKLSIAQQRTITQEEAYIENTITNRIKENIFFLAGDSVSTTKGVIPNLHPVSIALDVAHFIVDKSAISACGAPNEKIRVTEIGDWAIFDCEHMTISDYIPQVMSVVPERKDVSGEDSTKYAKGTVDFISKDNIGLGLRFDVNVNKEIKVEVPQGNYVTHTSIPGFIPSTNNVNKGGANLRPILKHMELVSQNGPLIFKTEILRSATVGKEYVWYLCTDVNSKSDLCLSPENPTGGLPPYHFQLDTMGGFPPLGIKLNLNGMIEGTPSKEGQYTFRICAVDMAGSQSCQTFTLVVKAEEETKPSEEPKEPEKPSGNGCFCMFTNLPCTKNSDCPPDPATGVPAGCAC